MELRVRRLAIRGESYFLKRRGKIARSGGEGSLPRNEGSLSLIKSCGRVSEVVSGEKSRRGSVVQKGGVLT